MEGCESRSHREAGEAVGQSIIIWADMLDDSGIVDNVVADA